MNVEIEAMGSSRQFSPGGRKLQSHLWVWARCICVWKARNEGKLALDAFSSKAEASASSAQLGAAPPSVRPSRLTR